MSDVSDRSSMHAGNALGVIKIDGRAQLVPPHSLPLTRICLCVLYHVSMCLLSTVKITWWRGPWRCVCITLVHTIQFRRILLIRRCVSVVYCPALPLPLNGSLSTSDTVYNTLVTIACDVGYKHANDQTSKTVLCLDSVTWNDTAIDCQGVLCCLVR